MKIAILCDAFPPFKSSAAIQMGDLAKGFAQKNYDTNVFIPDSTIRETSNFSNFEGIKIIRIKSPVLKNISFLKRAFNETILPLILIKNIFFSKINYKDFDLLIWYSPSIFLWPVALFIKIHSSCPSYLILRDIFPNWALDLGLLKKGIPYYFFKIIEYFQYIVADKIGVQTKSNLSYFRGMLGPFSKKTEVLNNWLSKYGEIPIERNLYSKLPKDRNILIYSGNMGKAQNLRLWLELAKHTRDENFFIFVGRGTEKESLKNLSKEDELINVLFLDELDKEVLNSLYGFCHVGIISLSVNHKINNIPGKLLSYLQAGLPVLAAVNPGNDLKKILEHFRVGESIEDNSSSHLKENLKKLLVQLNNDKNLKERCIELWKNEFSTEAAVKKIKKEIVTK
tara:strand:+ start:8103 stop:9290 length:1188 start_codon:yes stop_codon:yes gene_type:complete